MINKIVVLKRYIKGHIKSQHYKDQMSMSYKFYSEGILDSLNKFITSIILNISYCKGNCTLFCGFLIRCYPPLLLEMMHDPIHWPYCRVAYLQ